MYSSYSNFYDVVLFSFTRTSAESNMDNNVANISFIVIIKTDLALRGFVATCHCQSVCLVYIVCR